MGDTSVQQRRKAGCFADIDIRTQAVKIKSAVPFSLGLGCSRSPLQKLRDCSLRRKEPTLVLTCLGAALTNEEYQPVGGGFTAIKVLTTKALQAAYN